VDSEHIYWIDPQTQTIGRAKLDGTDPEDEFITPPAPEPEPGVRIAIDLRGLAVDSEHIYWSNAGETILNDNNSPTAFYEGVIGRARLNGAGPATEEDPEFIKKALNPEALAVDSEHIYWTSPQYASPSGGGRGFIGKARKADGGEADPKLIETFETMKEAPGIAVDSEHIYWSVSSGNSSVIARAKLDGTGASGNDNIDFIYLGENVGGKGLAVQGNHIYWTTETDEKIGRATLIEDKVAEEKAKKEEEETGEKKTPVLVTEITPGLIEGANHPVGLAADANHLYWSSNGEAPPNPGNDLYQYDGAAKTLSDLAPDSTDPAGIDVRGVLGASEDASYVYFAANGVPDGVVGSPNARGEVAQEGDCKGTVGHGASGSCNLYLAHAGTVRFIAQLDAGNGESETDAANWAATPSEVFPNSVFQKTSRVTPDGQTLLFRSQRRLTGYENEGTSELYLYRAAGGEITCVSCNPTGEAPAPKGQPKLGSITTSAVIPSPPASTLSHNLSADGDRVFFESTDALVSTDTNGEAGCPRSGANLQQFPACTDVYEWEAQGSGSCDVAHAVAQGGCIYLISTGKGTEPALIADASEDGSEVFFFSRARLVGQDEDNLMDLYGARVDGGLASQNQPTPPPHCEAEGCKAAVTPPPASESAGSEHFSAPPQPGQKRCRPGLVSRHGRCVKKNSKHHRKAKKNHKRGRGAARGGRRVGS
jgi:hypothetical protein